MCNQVFYYYCYYYYSTFQTLNSFLFSPVIAQISHSIYQQSPVSTVSYCLYVPIETNFQFLFL